MSVTIVSSDNIPFNVPIQVATVSNLVESMDPAEHLADPIPMLDVDGATLEKVFEFCEHFLVEPMPEIPKPIPSNDLSTLVPRWYHEYLNIDHEALFRLANAANYMDIGPLLDLVCAKIASMIKDKNINEIRTTFSLEHDYTPEEEAAYLEDCKWCQ